MRVLKKIISGGIARSLTKVRSYRRYGRRGTGVKIIRKLRFVIRRKLRFGTRRKLRYVIRRKLHFVGAR